MMTRQTNGGQVASRGFLLQTLIAILEIVADPKKIESIRLEPDSDEDKTDYLLEYVGGRTKAVQVKSSKNQIGLPAVKKWAAKLKNDMIADEYELCLVGPVSGDVTSTHSIEGVTIPVPKSLDLVGMLQQASHRLDLFLSSMQMSSVPPPLRELIVDGLVGKLTAYSTGGTAISGLELVDKLKEWMLFVYPNAIREAQYQQIDFICDSFTLAPKAEGANDQISLLFPFTIVNDGLNSAVIEWLALRLTTDTGSWTYTPILTVDYTSFIQKNVGIESSVLTSTFRPFYVRKNDAIDTAILFGPKAGQPVPNYDQWKDRYFDIEVFAKLRGLSSYRSVFTMQQTIPGVAIERYLADRKSATLMRRHIDL